ncbi:unnamed protein product [[Candida] boidinii]|nr:unnamed protein product [[Candida] boidinii]
MVVKGRFSKKPRKVVQPNRKPPTDKIGKIASLTKMSDKDKALDILHEISLKVAPIMRKHNFQVGLLCEFYPKDNRLLGLNINKGSKICIRLRYPNNNSLFLPMSELIGTMLHELTHNLFGPHDDKFYKQLDELKEEFYDIQIRGSIESTGFKN